MKNLKKWIFLLGVLQFTETLNADEVFKNFTENRFDSMYNVNYFKTESNYASDGSQASLPAGYSFQIIDVAIQARYVLLEDLGLYGGLNIGSSEANDVFSTRRNSTLNFVNLGADYLFYQSQLMTIYADLSYHHALEKIAPDTDSTLNNSGASEVHASLTTLFDFSYLQPYGSIGVNYRLEGLSTLLTYSAGLQSSFGEFVLGAALNGYASVVDDSKTSTPFARDAVTNRVAATSKKFYSINPNNLDADLYMKYIFNKDFSLQANGGYSIVGSNSAIGYHVGLGFTWGFGGSHYDNYSKPPTTYKAMPNHPSNVAKPPVKKFQEDTNDGVNQDYFKPVKPAKDNYIDKVDGQPETAVEEEDFTTTVKKALPKNDNEYKIRLKKRKKKK